MTGSHNRVKLTYNWPRRNLKGTFKIINKIIIIILIITSMMSLDNELKRLDEYFNFERQTSLLRYYKRDTTNKDNIYILYNNLLSQVMIVQSLLPNKTAIN